MRIFGRLGQRVYIRRSNNPNSNTYHSRVTDFKFYEERNVAIFTTNQVLECKPILYVYHNDDGAWQFHSEQEPDLKDSKLVSL